MRRARRALAAAALLAASIPSAAHGQTPPAPPSPTPTPVAATPATPPGPPVASAPAPAESALPAPTAVSTSLRITEPPAIFIARLPPGNPFGSTAEVPSALPAKLPVSDGAVSAGFFVSLHVDPIGKVLGVRRDRDPIPSLVAESLKTLGRWTFTPARRGGQPVDTWGPFRLDLYVEVRAPKIMQMAFNPVTPTTPLPVPLDWTNDSSWLEGRRPPSPTDGSIPIEQVDTAPMPQKTPWSADSHKGPFSVRFWVKVDKSGRIERAIALEASDPVLLSYFRKAMNAWVLRPAQSGGSPVESWNDLTLGGQVSYSVEIKQIAALRQSLGP